MTPIKKTDAFAELKGVYMLHLKRIPMFTGAVGTIPWCQLICMNRPGV